MDFLYQAQLYWNRKSGMVDIMRNLIWFEGILLIRELVVESDTAGTGGNMLGHQ